MTIIITVELMNEHQPTAKEIADIFHKSSYDSSFISITKTKSKKQ